MLGFLPRYLLSGSAHPGPSPRSRIPPQPDVPQTSLLTLPAGPCVCQISSVIRHHHRLFGFGGLPAFHLTGPQVHVGSVGVVVSTQNQGAPLVYLVSVNGASTFLENNIPCHGGVVVVVAFPIRVMAFRRLVTSTGSGCVTAVCSLLRSRWCMSMPSTQRCILNCDPLAEALFSWSVHVYPACVFASWRSPSGGGSARVRWQSSGVHAAAFRLEVRWSWFESWSRASLQEDPGNPVRQTRCE